MENWATHNGGNLTNLVSIPSTLVRQQNSSVEGDNTTGSLSESLVGGQVTVGDYNGGYISIDGANRRIIINDGETNVAILGYLKDGF